MVTKIFMAGIKREVKRMASRRMYLCGMILVPILVMWFLLSLMSVGLPERVPTALVDMDHSKMSRTVSRSLDAMQVLHITDDVESYDQALAAVREGKIFGFFVIPANFERDALSGRKPTLEYYTNMTYFVPGTLSYKGFKTVAVATSGGVVKQTLASVGMAPEEIADMIQPLVVDQFPLHNPWLNYSVYLSPSFGICCFVLMIMIMTVFSITLEIKDGTSPQWLATADNNISVAVASKLIPHTLVYFAVGLFLLWMLFGYSAFPLNGSLWWMIALTFLTVIGSQAFALFIVSVVPNPRLSFSLCCLFGILSFSFAGFSFPVQSMYGSIGIFSYLAPIRYWFLSYVNIALNGVDIYYSRYYFAALLAFPFVACTMLWNLKRMCLKPVYVP